MSVQNYTLLKFSGAISNILKVSIGSLSYSFLVLYVK